jgi:hypothetical protein
MTHSDSLSTEGGGPVLFAALMDRSTDNLQREVGRRLTNEANAHADLTTGWVCDLIHKAYAAGVTDGYAQGVQAEATREMLDKEDGA